MLPITDLVRPKRLPVVTLALVLANLIMWVAYQIPEGLDRSVAQLGFRPCEVNSACIDTHLAWPFQLITSMFAHGGWSHIVGNLVFLVVFGPRIEDLLGRRSYLLMYIAAGVAADALQGGLTLAFAGGGDARIPNIGASGAISGVLGAYALAYPFDRVLSWIIPVLFVRMPAMGLLGIWFLLQVAEGAYALENPAGVVGIAFFAHVGGFLVGLAAATLATRHTPPILRTPARTRPPAPVRGLG